MHDGQRVELFRAGPVALPKLAIGRPGALVHEDVNYCGERREGTFSAYLHSQTHNRNFAMPWHVLQSETLATFVRLFFHASLCCCIREIRAKDGLDHVNSMNPPVLHIAK